MHKNPDGTYSDSNGVTYEKKHLYKVNYLESNAVKTLYCESESDAKKMRELLKGAGCKNVGVNVWSWQAFIEE